MVLDSSALLAWLFQEPGHEQVDAVLDQAVISTVNWSEVQQKSQALGLDTTTLADQLLALQLSIAAFEVRHAEWAAALWPQTQAAGLSLADRACLALAQHCQQPAYTADRAWASLEVGVDIVLIR